MDTNDFVDWLRQQLELRAWSYQDLADRSGLSKGTIGVVMTEKQNPGFEFCKCVAQAFRMRPEEVLRIAGLLPSVPGDTDDPSLSQWWEFGKELTPEERQEAVEYALWRFKKDHDRARGSRTPTGQAPAPSTSE